MERLWEHGVGLWAIGWTKFCEIVKEIGAIRTKFGGIQRKNIVHPMTHNQKNLMKKEHVSCLAYAKLCISTLLLHIFASKYSKRTLQVFIFIGYKVLSQGPFAT